MQHPRWIIWSALTTSLLVYVGVAAALQATIEPQPAWRAFVFALIGVAAGTAVLSWELRRRLLLEPARRGELDPEGAGEQRFLQLSIVNWALCESIGVYGLVCFVLFGSWPLLLGFVGAALVLLGVHAPRLGPLTSPSGRPDLPHRPDPIA